MLKILKIFIGIIFILILYFNGLIDPRLIDFSYKSILVYIFVLLLISITIFLATIRLYIILNVLNVKISFNYVYKINYVGVFFNQCLPGGQGGDIVKIIYLIKKYKFFNKITLISYIIIDRLFGLTALYILFLISLYCLSGFNESLLNLFYIFIILSFIILISVFIFIYFNIFKILENRIKNYKNYFANIGRNYFNDLKNLKNFNISTISKLLILSFIIFIIAILGIVLLIGENYFNIDSIIKIFFASSVTFFANSVPISFNGLGVGEYVFSQLSTIFYDDKLVLFGNIFLIYRILMILSSLPGLVIFILFNK